MIKDENTQDSELDEKKITNEDDQNNDDDSQDDSKDDDKSSNQSDKDDDKSDDKDWKAEAAKWRDIAQRNKDKKTDTTKTSKSDEFDYGKKAFLTANGIKGSKEIDFVKEEAKKSGLELDELLENEYFQSKLAKFRALNKTADATIKGKDSKGVQTDSVEYWMNKPIEEVPHELRIKVVNAKLKQDQSKGMFYNQK